MGKLTQKKIRELFEPGRYSDGDGLYLHVRPGGSRQWVLRVTVGQKRKDIGLGSASLFSLADAREQAFQLRKLAKQGIDPVQLRRQTKSIPTYREAAEVVWSQQKPSWKNPKHSAQWMSTQKTYAFPYLADKRVDEITSSDILRVLEPIWLSKGETARRLKQRMQSVFDWAKAMGHRSGDSPLEGIERALPRQKRAPVHHAAMSWKDLPAFIMQLRERDAMSALALQMLILTAVRSGELRHARWEEFDIKNKVWIIPAERMKMKKEHRVPLSQAVLSILHKAKPFGSRIVFPSDNPTKPLSDMVFKALFQRMGFEGITAHGFRSSFRDWASETNSATREIAEMALAHAVGDATEQAYARSDLLERRREVMEKWAAFLHGGSEGGDVAHHDARR